MKAAQAVRQFMPVGNRPSFNAIQPKLVCALGLSPCYTYCADSSTLTPAVEGRFLRAHPDQVPDVALPVTGEPVSLSLRQAWLEAAKGECIPIRKG